MTGTLRVFDLSVGEMLWSRRTIFMALVVGMPVALAAVFRVLDLFGVPAMRVNGAQVSGPAIFGAMIWLLYLRFLVPVLGAFYGTALIADEVEDRTITYLFTRPISRGTVLAGKYLAYLVCTALVVLPSVMIVYFLVTPMGGGLIGQGFPLLLIDMGLLGLGLVVYGAVFALVGAKLKRPLVVGLVFAFGWEQLALLVPGYLRRLTVAYYLQALVPHAMPQDDTMTAIQSLFAERPSAATSLFWLAVILVACLGWAVRTVERREYVLEQ
jgi:ABC-type transport system involved in multi-copper enzyme maturation permease subunit